MKRPTKRRIWIPRWNAGEMPQGSAVGDHPKVPTWGHPDLRPRQIRERPLPELSLFQALEEGGSGHGLARFHRIRGFPFKSFQSPPCRLDPRLQLGISTQP